MFNLVLFCLCRYSKLVEIKLTKTVAVSMGISVRADSKL